MIGKRSCCYCTSARLGTVRAFAAVIAALATLAFAASAQAQTDTCSSPTVVFDGATPINLTGATSTGLPACGNFPSGNDAINNDLFVSYTASCDGTLFVDTCGNSFDARLAVYGANVDCTAINGGALPVECNDDHANATEGDTGMVCPNALSSSLSIPVNSGDVHIIRVGSFSTTAQTASFNLNIACLAGGSGACCLPLGGCTDVTNGTTECDGLGGTYQGDFTTCATAGCPEACTTCLTPVNTFPYSEDFEVGLGLWTQSANDNFDWTRDSAGTPSSGTGPSVDHTLGTSAGFYMFTETSQGSAGSTFILDGPCFDLATLTNPAFTFWRHMFGATMGTLSVEISTDNCLNYTPIFSLSGDQGDVWVFEQIDLSAYAGQQVNIRFVGVRGSSFTGDMAIDDIGVGESAIITGSCCALDGSCSEVTEADCALSGGIYGGNLSTCAGTQCTGACCLNASCVSASELSCSNAGGIYLGGGSVCGVDPCPPSNDDCAGAIEVFDGANNGGNNCAALADNAEASCQSNSNKDVWFFWTATCTGDATIDTVGSLFTTSNDTVLSIWDACGGTEIDCDDDSVVTPALLSTLTFPCTQGVDYYIRVAGFSTNCGDINLNIACALPPVGRCCQADGTCTIESSVDCGNLGGIYGGDNTDCTVSCFGACCLPANGGCISETEASCTNAGGTYAGDATECFTFDILTGASNGGVICEGSCADLTILRNSPAHPSDIDIMFNNDIATADGIVGSCTGGGTAVQNDAYFRYLAISATNGPCDVTITATPTGYDAVLVVRDACDGTELACSDVGLTGGAESVIIPNYGPAPLFIQVGDFGTTEGGGLTQLEVTCSTLTGACCMGGTCDILTAGNCALAGGIYKGDNTDCLTSCFGACCVQNGTCSSVTQVSCSADGGTYQGDGTSCTPNPCPQPPANDDCAGAIEVFDGTNNGGNNCLASTVDDAEASCQTNSGKDVWFFWTATCTGEATIDTEGSVFTTSNDTVLSVYDACGGTELACDDDDGTGLLSTLTLSVTQGVDYYIRVAGFSSNCGDITLNISCTALCGTCPGDMNGDSRLDGLDIQTFTNCYIAEFGTNPSAACKCADVNEDNTLDASDITLFVDLILNGGGICNPGACCYLDGGSAVCAVTDAAGCALLGGDFTLGADCSGDPCPAGRCCSNGGLTCNDIPELECIALGGSWTAGIDCIGTPCPIMPINDGCGGAIVAFDGATPVDLTNATHSGLASCGDFPFGGATNQEVNNDLWYEYVASCTGTLFVDTCGSTFDTRLAVYDVDCNAILGGALPVECNDDHGNTTEMDTGNTCVEGLAASLSIPVTSGNTYLVRVGSFSQAAQTAMFNLNIACVAGGNGSCCLADGNCVDVTGGVTECSGLGGTYNGDGSSCATTICGGACCLANGSCVDAMTGSDCVDNIGGTYQGNGTSCATTSCPQPPPSNDSCANALAVSTGTTVGVNNCGASMTDDLEASCRAASDRDVFYSWVADCTGDATIDTEGSVLTNNDTVLSVYETSCGGAEVACNDDIGFPNFLSSVTFPVTSGSTYIIRVAGWDADECGDIVLNIACSPAGFGSCCLGDGSCVDVTNGDTECMGLGGTYNGDGTNCATTICGGACCLANGSCVDALTGSDCVDNIGGTYQGNGTECASTQCPQPLPANDMCANAEAMSIGATVTGYTISATPETLGTCGTSDGTGGAVWYSVIGDGTTLTATTCNPGTDFDTKLRVYTDGCATLTCVGGNDDQSGAFDAACDSTGTGFNRASTFSWCSTNGVEYLILVHGFSTAEGNFEMTVTSNFTPCP
ncbi:MAG: hypothetical protein H6818_07725 [Phycisphaerales bacterium]|nr:hypothetical protein [Phycisphaerales bacterium]MCB9864214.1 hypothetical protein [Phycisphaerales bacterium]